MQGVSDPNYELRVLALKGRIDSDGRKWPSKDIRDSQLFQIPYEWPLERVQDHLSDWKNQLAQIDLVWLLFCPFHFFQSVFECVSGFWGSLFH